MKSLVLGLCLVATTAAAQSPDPEPTPAPAPDPEPPPPPPPQVVQTTTPPPPMPPQVADDRPTGFSIGIGVGYQLPTSLETPNVTSARLRFASGLTLEPVVRLQQASVDIDTGMSDETKETTLELGTLVRYPLKTRGRVDLVVLGGAFLEHISLEPSQMDADSTLTRIEARYGMAIEFWISPHWQISMAALNTILRTERISQEQGFETETVTTNTTVGAIYDPVVSAMVHLYY